jgi:hypothetical protein
LQRLQVQYLPVIAQTAMQVSKMEMLRQFVMEAATASAAANAMVIVMAIAVVSARVMGKAGMLPAQVLAVQMPEIAALPVPEPVAAGTAMALEVKEPVAAGSNPQFF